MPLLPLDCAAGSPEWFDGLTQVQVDDSLQPILNSVLRAGRIASERRQYARQQNPPSDLKELAPQVIAGTKRIIVDAIRENEPDAVVVLEDKSTSAPPAGADAWYVKALSGVKAYVNGSDDWAVLVSRISADGPFSVALFPDAGLLAVADDVYLLACEARTPVANANLAAPVHIDFAYGEIECQPGEVCDRDRYAGARLMVEVALGRTDAVVTRMCGQKSWDLAATTHIAAAGGVAVTDERGVPLSYAGAECSARGYVVAARSYQLQQSLVYRAAAKASASSPQR